MSSKPELVVLCQGVWPIFGFARKELEAAAADHNVGVLGYWRHWPDTLKALGYETLILKQPPLGGQQECSEEAFKQLQPYVDEGRQLILIGHSRGGWIVRAVACRYPENTRACVTVACPQTGQWLADFHLAMGQDESKLKGLIEGRVDGAVKGVKETVKDAIKALGRTILPDEIRQLLRQAIGRARNARDELSGDLLGALKYLQAEAGTWDQIYADYNTPAAVGANKALPNQDDVVYVNVLGELGKDGFVPPELSTSTILLEMVSKLAVLPPVGDFKQLVSDFERTQSGDYTLDVEAFTGDFLMRNRRHDGATHADCCVIPWGVCGPEWPSDNPSTKLTWKLDHCRQVGLFPSPLLVPYIQELIGHVEERRAAMDAAASA